MVNTINYVREYTTSVCGGHSFPPCPLHHTYHIHTAPPLLRSRSTLPTKGPLRQLVLGRNPDVNDLNAVSEMDFNSLACLLDTNYSSIIM